MSPRASVILGGIMVLAWSYLVLIRQEPAGWPHALYAVGVLMIIRWIALRDRDAVTS